MFNNMKNIIEYKNEHGIVALNYIEDKYILFINNKENISFDTFSDFMKYIRNVRMDNAINFELKYFISGVISEIYKNKDIKITDILN